MKKLKNFKLFAGAGLLLGLTALGFGLYMHSPSTELSSSQFQYLASKRLMREGTVTPSAYPGIYTIEGKYSMSASHPAEGFSVTTALEGKALSDLLAQGKVRLSLNGKTTRNQWINIVATLLIAGSLVFVLAHQMHLTGGRSMHKIRERPDVRFADVAGVEEAKSEMQEIVDFLRHPRKYRQLGGKLPKGVLLIGPPGTGKTMLAKAIAGEANANFFSAHGSDFNEVFVGVGAKRVREIFRQAARNKPAIIFIDEIDCLGKNRRLDTNGELQQTNNALLASMDGFESSEGIVVMAATNRPEDLDEALLRPGRFDRKIHVPYPDMKGRRAILETHARNKPILDPDKALSVIAQTTPGMSGADLANLVNEAAILCAQLNASSITLSELEAARDKVRFGKERKSMVLKQSEREMVAYHEAGHAIINLQTTLLPPLYKVSIVPRGNALGVTTLLPTEDQNLHSRDNLLEQLLVLMGGRAAEKVFFGGTTNGAGGDLDTARKIAQKMVHEWGMGDKLFYTPEQSAAEHEINRLLEAADRHAFIVVQARKGQTQKLARALLQRETLTREEVMEVIGETSKPGEAAFGLEYFPM